MTVAQRISGSAPRRRHAHGAARSRRRRGTPGPGAGRVWIAAGRLGRSAARVAIVAALAPIAAAQTPPAQSPATAPSALSATPTSWPMFRGGAALTGVAGCTLPEDLRVRWTFRASEAFESSAAIVDGTVYVGCDDGRFYALDLATGGLRWTFTTSAPPPPASAPTAPRAPAGAGDRSAAASRAATTAQASVDDIAMVRSSATVFDGTVYFGDDGGTYYALRAADGELRWRYQTQGEIISGTNVHDGRLIFGSYDGKVYCLTPDGGLSWEFETAGRVHATPAIADGRVLVAGCDAVLRVLDARDGRPLGEFELGAYCGASPAVIGSVCYVGTFGERVLAIDWRRRELLWFYEHATRRFPYLSSPAATGAAVFVGGRDRIVHGLDRASGAARWEHQTGGRVESSPVVSGGRVYVGSGDGRVYAFDAETGRVAWEFDTGAPVSASPAIADGCLVIGTEDGVLYSFSGDAGAGPESAARAKGP